MFKTEYDSDDDDKFRGKLKLYQHASAQQRGNYIQISEDEVRFQHAGPGLDD